jgi:dihydropteroate synthase
VPEHTPVAWRLRTRTLTTADHTLISGVVNVTPDSFSDGGAFDDGSGAVDHKAAVEHGIRLAADGADLIDVGGESTRPGSQGVSAAEELDRVLPVVSALAGEGIVVSVDTSKSEVAAAAIEAGAEAINDVTALVDPALAMACAESGVGVVLLHMQGVPETMQLDPRYEDVLADVAGELQAKVAQARAAGIDAARICVDPGIGFGKSHQDNLQLLAGLGTITGLGYPVMVGTSRKGFLGEILQTSGYPAEASRRDPATGATVALAIAAGATVVRVHNVAAALQSARTADAIVRIGQS